ncbi:MAG: hypothetical protein IMF14_07515, partial [Proteobacteria bacterium]|nr:hypothetical protein [Pseudomonadota bacterium]
MNNQPAFLIDRQCSKSILLLALEPVQELVLDHNNQDPGHNQDLGHNMDDYNNHYYC